MTTQTQPASPFATATTYLGEIVAWELPTGGAWTHSALAAALKGAGLDEKAARPLSARNVFVRAVRARAKGHLCRELCDTADTLTFQLTVERKGNGRLDYDFEATVSLDKATGAVTATDAALEATVRGELVPCTEARKVTDVTRLIRSLFTKNADLFTFKPGVYFVPQVHAAFLQQIDTFVRDIGGSLDRIQVPASSPQSQSTVAGVMSDGLYSLINEYEAALAAIRSGTAGKGALAAAMRAVEAARIKIGSYREYLGTHHERLIDHTAFVARLLADEKAAQAAAPAPDVAVGATPEAAPVTMLAVAVDAVLSIPVVLPPVPLGIMVLVP